MIVIMMIPGQKIRLRPFRDSDLEVPNTFVSDRGQAFPAGSSRNLIDPDLKIIYPRLFLKAPLTLYVIISIHHPHPDKERLVIDSMDRYGEAAKRQHGLISVDTLKDENTGELVGLAIWDSKESFLAARPALMEATANDDFESWEKEPIRRHRLIPV
jgi:heme-degrading monooxygenase HmoA